MAQEVQQHRLHWPVPDVGDLIQIPDSRIYLRIIQDGDRNLRWFNVANCVTKMTLSYRARQLLEIKSPWLECIIQNGFLLEGYVRMVPAGQDDCGGSGSGTAVAVVSDSSSSS